MNKEEKIGMYTRNEIFEHLCENNDIGMLERSMYDAVMSKIDNLQSQLKLEKLDNEIKSVINIIKQQPSNDDEWILGRLNGFLSIIGGE